LFFLFFFGKNGLKIITSHCKKKMYHLFQEPWVDYVNNPEEVAKLDREFRQKYQTKVKIKPHLVWSCLNGYK
jgi:hypothetical protein